MASSTTAFAANLLGAMVGGMLEYLSLITGYRVLLVLAGGLYALAFITGARRARVAEISGDTRRHPVGATAEI